MLPFLNPIVPTKRNESALTLIETLVVVAVLALAFALFLPALLPAKRRPSRLNCVNNVVLGDGSVWQFSSMKLREALANSGVTNRLAIP